MKKPPKTCPPLMESYRISTHATHPQSLSHNQLEFFSCRASSIVLVICKSNQVNFFSFESSSPVLMICRSNPKTRKRVNWCKNKATHLQFRSLNPTKIIREICSTSYQKRLHCCHGVPSCNLRCSRIFKLVNQWRLQLLDQVVKVDTEENPSCKQNC